MLMLKSKSPSLKTNAFAGGIGGNGAMAGIGSANGVGGAGGAAGAIAAGGCGGTGATAGVWAEASAPEASNEQVMVNILRLVMSKFLLQFLSGRLCGRYILVADVGAQHPDLE